MNNMSMTTRNFTAIGDILHRIIAITQVLANDGESHETRAKLETIHEDTVQDTDRAEDWIPRFGAYFDMTLSKTHQHEFQHYFVRACNSTANPKVSPMSIQDDVAEEIAKAEQAKGDWLTRSEIEDMFTQRDAMYHDKALRKKITAGHLVKDARSEITRARGARAAASSAAAAVAPHAKADAMRESYKKSASKAAAQTTANVLAAAFAKLGVSIDGNDRDAISEMFEGHTDNKQGPAQNQTEQAEPATQQGAQFKLPSMVAAAHDFTASTEWKDMQAWRTKMTKDQEETKRTVGKLTEAQSKMADDIASGCAENAISFDSLIGDAGLITTNKFSLGININECLNP